MKSEDHLQPAKPADRPPEKHIEWHYIDSPSRLDAWVTEMRLAMRESKVTRCCIDTEADSLHHYQEKLCLIQLGFADRYALVDPLAIRDMSPLIEVLDDCELWLHGADYDLTMLKRTYNWIPKQVRDTQIAARLVGYRQFGLAALVHNVFGATLSKASQKADWSRRPLPHDMLSYAVDDVRYLLSLADHLLDQLAEKRRDSWFLQSCQSLQRLVAGRSMQPRDDPWRVQGSGRLHPKGLALLRSLWEWREQVAEERDVPCFRVMSNKQMLDYAEQFESGAGLHPPAGWRPKWKKDFAAIVSQVLESEPASWPGRIRKARGRLSEEASQRVDQLCRFRDERALDLGVESSLLGSRAVLEQVVVSMDAVSELLPWQRDLLHDELERIRMEPQRSRPETDAGTSMAGGADTEWRGQSRLPLARRPV